MSIVVRYTPDPVKNKTIEHSFHEEDYLLITLMEFRGLHRDKNPEMFKERVCIYINNEEWEVDDWNTCHLETGDIVEVIPAIGGGNGGVISIIAGVVLMVAAVWITIATGGAFAPYGAWMFKIGMAMAIGGAIQLIFAPSMPNMPSFSLDGGGATQSPSYRWDGPTTQSLGGIPIPVIYGEQVVAGNILSYYKTEKDDALGDKDIIHLLIGLGEGPITGVLTQDESNTYSAIDPFTWKAFGGESTTTTLVVSSDASETPWVKLNEQWLSNLSSKGAVWSFRPGTRTQSTISGFKQIHSFYEQSIEVVDAWTELNTTSVTVNELRIKVVFPALFEMNDSGDVVSRNVFYKVQYRIYGSGDSWTSYKDTSENTRLRQEIETQRVNKQEAYDKLMELNAQGVGADHYTAAPYLAILNEANRIITLNTNLLNNDWIHDLGSKTAGIAKYITISDLPSNQYEIRIKRKNKPSTNVKIKDRVYVTGLDEVEYKDIAYRHTALLYLKIPASESLHGQIPNVTVKVRGKKVEVPKLQDSRGYWVEFNDCYYDDTAETYKTISGDYVCTKYGTTKQWTQNPAYCLKDFLTNTRYGLGEYIKTSNINSAYIDTAAERCWTYENNEHKFHLDINIDNEMDAREAIQLIAKTFRAWLIYSEGTIKVICDTEGGTAVQLFSMGNILKDSFSETFLPLSQIPNIYELQFADEAHDYKIGTKQVIYEPDWVANKPKRIHKDNFRGITRESQALRDAKFGLNVARHCNKVISFKGAMDSVHCESGDKIKFQHDVNEWGQGGRIVRAVSASRIQVDTDITPVANDRLFCRLANGTVQDLGVSSLDTTDRYIITASAFTSAPLKDSVWAYGQNTTDIQEYRIVSISRDKNNEVAIAALNFNASIYDDSHVLVASPVQDIELPDYGALCASVTDLTLTAMANQPGLFVGFHPPSEEYYSYAEVWYSNANSEALTFVANDYGDGNTEIKNITPGESYKVKVFSINKEGKKNDDDYARKTVVTAEFSYPWGVTGLRLIDGRSPIEYQGKDAKFEWRPNSPIAGFGIFGAGEEPSGLGWSYKSDQYIIEIWVSDSLVRTEVLTDSQYVYTYEKNRSDNGTAQSTFTIKVWGYVIENGKKSKDNTELTVSNSVPITPTLLTSHSVEDGAMFELVKNTNDDFSHYNYQYAVKPEAGSYGASRDWITTHNNEIQMWLSPANMVSQNRKKSNIRAAFYSEDVFGNVSDTLVASQDTKNLRREVIVAPTQETGVYTSIASALYDIGNDANIDSCSVYVKEGEYNITATITLPAKSVDIIGAGYDKTVFVGSPRSFFYKNGGANNRYAFKDFGIRSTTASQFCRGFHFNITEDGNTIECDRLNLVLQNNGQYYKTLSSLLGDVGVYVSNVSNDYTLKVRDCTSSGGRRFCEAYYVKDVEITNNKVYNNSRQSVLVYAKDIEQDGLQISDNLFKTFGYQQPIHVLASPRWGEISNNFISITIASKHPSQTRDYGAMYLIGAHNTSITNNKINFTASMPSATVVDGTAGLYINHTQNAIISGNSIDMVCGSNFGNRGIWLAYVDSSTITDNNVTWNVLSPNARISGGIWLAAGELNTLSNNYVNSASPSLLTNTGISLGAGARYNTGNGNMVVNAKTCLADAGASNDVTATCIIASL